ncbi:MAG: 50S ribosomal protein L18 [Gemmatimonadales bacterium]
MRSVYRVKTSAERRARRHLRVRKRVTGTAARPRLVVFRSSKHIYAQLVDDDQGRPLLGASDRSEGLAVEGPGKVAKGFAVGRLIAAHAKERGITRVVFDRGGYLYHGRVKAVADGARKGGLEF